MNGETPTAPQILDPASATDRKRGALFGAGFAVVPRLVGDHVVETLRIAYDDLVEGRVRAQGDRKLGGLVRQIKDPSLDHPVFQENLALELGEFTQRVMHVEVSG